ARLTADAAAGASQAKLARELVNSQHVLRANGNAAAAYGRQLGLTPKLVRTIVRQINMEKAQAAVRALKRQYAALPTKIQLELKSKGIPETKADAQKMAKDLNLAAKPRKLLMTFVDDAAKQKITTISGLLDKVDKKKPKPKVDVDTSGASTKLQTIQAQINALHGKTVTVTVQRGSQFPTFGAPGSADGGTVPKTGQPYADRHLYLLADGEEVVSNRHGQADRNRDLLKAINAGRLADGGTTGRAGGVTYTRPNQPDPGWKNLRDHLKATTKELEREKNARAALVDKMHTLSTSVQDGLRSDLFGSNNPWQSKYGGTSPAGVMGTLRGDTSDIRAEITAIKTLKQKGVTGDALAAILSQGGLEGAKAFAALPAKELAAYERLFNQRARLLHTVGDLAGSAAYGGKLSDETKAIHTLTQEVRLLKRQLHHDEQQAHRDRKNHTDSQKRGASSAGRKNSRAS
ncbi:MAG TPA: hypothetical protein VN088_13795, partial [Nocardioides sp.]|nr:hypothetical protein [Nocardioides sp.]